MKHIQLFEDFINEFNTGKVLLGDPSTLGRPSKWEELGIEFEPNTADESELIELLKTWIMKGSVDSKMGQILKELLPLKKKFPNVLEPSAGRKVYDGTSLYRGTEIPLKEVLAMKGKWKHDKDSLLYETAVETLIIKTAYNWESLNRKGFTSFTPSPEVAISFAGQSTDLSPSIVAAQTIIKRLADGYTGGMIPVILKIKDTHSQSIINPIFTQSANEFMNEFEVFVVGNKIKVDEVIISGWYYYDKYAKEFGVDLTKYFKM